MSYDRVRHTNATHKPATVGCAAAEVLRVSGPFVQTVRPRRELRQVYDVSAFQASYCSEPATAYPSVIKGQHELGRWVAKGC
ncbi:hypothetical protein VTG60DRAFT_104 [Thermothelomyces hinnuleus]